MTVLTAPSQAAGGAGLEAAECSHCGLPVPRGLIEAEADHQFCCGGCRAVFEIINDRGLDPYYKMRRAAESSRSRVPEREAAYEAFDDDAVTERFTSLDADGRRQATLVLEGLHCAACVWLIDRLAHVVPGVLATSVHFGRSTVEVVWAPGVTSLAPVARGLHAIGYPVSLPRGESAEARWRADSRRQLIRIGVAGALAGNIMIVSVALYAGVFEGIEPVFRTLFRWVSAVLGILTLAWPGRTFFRGAHGALRTRTAHLDLPIALALAVGGAWGLANTVRGTGEIYFDSLAALVFLLLAGRFLQSQQQRRAAQSIDLLLTIMPQRARRVPASGAAEMVPIDSVAPGDTLEILAGETIPIDGRIAAGETEVDQAILTGEAAAVRVARGDDVWAGAVNLTSTIRIEATASADDTRAARLMRLVSDAIERKAPVVHLADRLAGWFVVIVATLAVATAALWATIDPGTAIEHGIALLIVTCPCALGLATPLVLSAAVGRLAHRGVLVKGGSPIEGLARPGTIFLDKTGTLTTGRFEVAEWTVPEPTRRRVRAIERGSTHPIARAIADSGPVGDHDAADMRTTHGAGIEARIDGHEVIVGTPQHLRDRGVEVDDVTEGWGEAQARLGRTPVLIAENGRTAGAVSLRAEIRDDAAPLLDRLRRDGWQIELLSGDDPRAVRALAEELGIAAGAAHGRVGPEQKMDRVRAARERGQRVVMVGDGVNDAGALAAADVGVGVEGGAEACLEAADVSIQSGGLAAVSDLLETSRRAMRRIRLCIVFSLGYNVIAAGLAMAGAIHPIAAAVLMPLSSLTVVAIAATAGGGDKPCR
ncbi:MAG: heavy metal translocating P-type ATPase [Planctomycetota bacterium]